MPRDRDTVVHTFWVALKVCLVCSLLVSGAAVMLRDTQEANKNREMQKNILAAAGLFDEHTHKARDVPGIFEDRVETKVVDFKTNWYTDKVSAADYDQKKASKDPELSAELDTETDIAGIKRRERYSLVYLVKNDAGELDQIVLPIRGYGLWSTLWGFLAIDAKSLKAGPEHVEVRGITYYEHFETPGLGGEVDNARWKSLWKGKHVYGSGWKVELQVIKGNVDANTENPTYKVDGLSGATITSRGVSNMIEFWMGENGFGPFLKKLRAELNE